MNAFRKYKKGQCIVFRKTTGKYGALSNMASGFTLKINSVVIRSSEALYQALRYPDFPEIQKEIISQFSPMTAKMKSKKYYSYTRKDWNEIRFKIMKFCLELKLFQNWDKFYQVLLSTGNLPIVEYAPEGKIWGAAPKGDYYEGINALGRLLMELRENYIINKKAPELFIPKVENLKFLDKIIDANSIELDSKIK